MIKSNSLIAQQPTNPKIVFFGSSKYSPIVAQKLQQKLGITLVVTIPDKPKGRERKLTANPMSEFAIKNKIEVLTANKLTSEIVTKIATKSPDFLTVDDYGLILPDELIKIPKYAPLNVHHSLLPKYRGPSPAPSAILAGEKTTGVTIIKMTSGVDAGPILAQKKYTLDPKETTNSLLIKLNTIGSEILTEVINDYLAGRAKPVKQEQSKTTYTQRFKKENGFININTPPDPKRLDRMIRAFYPWPCVWTELEATSGKRQVTRLRIKLLPPPILLTPHPTDPFLIQPEGKRPLTISEFKNGYPQQYEQIKKLLDKQAHS